MNSFSGTLRLLALALVFSALSVCPMNAQAAEPEPGTATVSESKGPAAEQRSREESGEDETAQFKHSASVRMLSKITGLSLDGAYWLAVILNFAIVAGLIAWFAKTSLPGAFRNRTASIQRSLEEARHASKDANRRLSEIESRLSRLGEEIGEMRAASEKEAAAEEERTRAAAGEEARRILDSAQQEIAVAAKTARRELIAYAADLALTLANKQIHVDTPTDQALLRQFRQQLSNDGGAGRRSS
jgi:F-type H+-transporting ATPase subunit b